MDAKWQHSVGVDIAMGYFRGTQFMSNQHQNLLWCFICKSWGLNKKVPFSESSRRKLSYSFSRNLLYIPKGLYNVRTSEYLESRYSEHCTEEFCMKIDCKNSFCCLNDALHSWWRENWSHPNYFDISNLKTSLISNKFLIPKLFYYRAEPNFNKLKRLTGAE